jgi:hypothetical protein
MFPTYPVLKIVIIIIMLLLLSQAFFPALLLNRQWSPPPRLQISDCSTFLITCDVPSIAVFCSESVECFPRTASRHFLKPFVTITVAPVIIDISYISDSTFVVSLYIKSCILASFPLPLGPHFNLQVLSHLSVEMFYLFLFLIIISGLLLLLLLLLLISFLVINALGQQPSDLCYGLYVEHKDHNKGLHAHVKRAMNRKNKSLR